MEPLSHDAIDSILKLTIAGAFGAWAWFLKRWIEKTDKHFDNVMSKIWDHEKRLTMIEARNTKNDAD